MDTLILIETGDPDDIFALLILLSKSNVRGVCVYKGCPKQIGFIRELVGNIPIGMTNVDQELRVVLGKPLKPPTSHLSAGLPSLFPGIECKEEKGDTFSEDIIYNFVTKYPKGVLVTCGPVSDIAHALIKYPKLIIPHIVSQGGFAGSRCNPIDPLPKFKDKEFVGTWNLNCDTRASEYIMNSKRVLKHEFISKDICHKCYAPKEWLGSKDPHVALVQQALQIRRKRPNSKPKKLHDVVAVLYTLGELEGIEMTEVTLEKNRHSWGSKPQKGTNVWISTGIDLDEWNGYFSIKSPNVSMKSPDVSIISPNDP